MTTALGLVQAALYEFGITPPSTLLTATNLQQQNLKNILYAEARYLRSLANWPQQKKVYTFDLESGRTKYPYPPDFYAPVAGTFWDTDIDRRLNGPASDAEFSEEQIRGTGQNNPATFRPFGPDGNIAAGTSGGQFQIPFTPSSSGESLSLEYYSKNLFQPPYWTASEAGITTSKYRFCNGLILDCTAITTGTCGTTPPSASGVDGGVTWTVLTTPYETIIADEDQCIFDDDIMICGIKWRYLKSKKMDFSVEADEYKRLLLTAQARFKGSFIGTFARRKKGPRYTVPRGGWNL